MWMEWGEDEVGEVVGYKGGVRGQVVVGAG